MTDKYWTERFPHETNTERIGCRIELFSKMVKDNNIDSVLELGCSTGGNLLGIYNVAPETKLCGIDISKKAINHGIEIEKNPATFIRGSITDPTVLAAIDSDSFDLVFTAGVLTWLNYGNMQKIVKEMLRISKHFVVHIEVSGKCSEAFRYVDAGRMAMYKHPFKKVYESLNMVFNTKGLSAEYGRAKHLIWINKYPANKAGLLLPEIP